jgi:hypothetical protein
MKQKMRVVLVLLPALALVVSMAPRGGKDGGGNICVIAGDIAACAPPNDSPS